MPELRLKYGNDVQIGIYVELADEAEGDSALTMNTDQGFVLGSVDGSAVPLKLSFVCTNDEVTHDTAFIAETDIMLTINFEIVDYVLSI